MNSEWLQSVCTAIMLIGLVLTGMGGFGTYYFGRKSGDRKELSAQLPDRGAAREEPRHQGGPLEPEVARTTSQKVQATQPAITPQPQPPGTGTIAQPSSTEMSLDKTQRQKILAVLHKHPGKTITINAVEGHAESYGFAEALRSLFVEAGWRVEDVQRVAFVKPPDGLSLSTGTFPMPDGLVAASESLTSAGFHVSQQLDSKLKGGQTVLTVGLTPAK